MSGYKPSICFGDGVLFREGSAKVLKYIYDIDQRGGKKIGKSFML